MTPERYTAEVARTASNDNDALVVRHLDADPIHGADLALTLAVAVDSGVAADRLKKGIFHGHAYVPDVIEQIRPGEGSRAARELIKRFIVREYPYGGPLIMATLGCIGESAELGDLLGNAIFSDGSEALDRDHIIKELGDIMWYVARAALALDIPLEEVMQRNVDKLRKRYPEGFSAERSINREGN